MHNEGGANTGGPKAARSGRLVPAAEKGPKWNFSQAPGDE